MHDQKRPGSLRPHRVSERFCGQGFLLQEGFHKHAVGLALSQNVSDELAAYEHAFIDESRAEGEHRNATYKRKRACPSTFPWWTASCPLQENLAAVDASKKHDGGVLLTSLWYRWKSVLQTRPRGQHNLQPKRINTKRFIERVYRLESVGLEDWSACSGPHKPGKIARPPKASSFEHMHQAILRDFCRCVFKDDTFYTLPDQADGSATSVATQCLGREGESSQLDLWNPVRGGRSFRCFQVVSSTPGSFKSPYDLCNDFVVPMYIQWHVAHGLPTYDGFAYV